MPTHAVYKGNGLLIQRAVDDLGISRKAAAKKLNISESALYKYFKSPPTDIELLIELSRKLKINLLSHYKDREPLKGMLEAYEKQLKVLEQENVMLKKDKEQLHYCIDVQKEMLGHSGTHQGKST